MKIRKKTRHGDKIIGIYKIIHSCYCLQDDIEVKPHYGSTDTGNISFISYILCVFKGSIYISSRLNRARTYELSYQPIDKIQFFV